MKVSEEDLALKGWMDMIGRSESELFSQVFLFGRRASHLIMKEPGGEIYERSRGRYA